MAQGSIVIPQTGPLAMGGGDGVAAKINAALLAGQTLNSGASAPTNGAGGATFTYQCWIDTSTSPKLLKIYDGSQFVTMFALDTDTHEFSVPAAVLDTLTLGGVVTPATLAANANDYAPTGLGTAAVLRLEASTGVAITGLAAQASGRVVVIHNVGSSNAITLSNNSSSSTAANRFAIGESVEIAANETAVVVYDGTSSRWRLLAAPAAAGGAAGGLTDLGVSANVGVSASASSGALTVNLTTAAGTTPSGGSRSTLPFRSATAGTGTITAREVTAGTSLAISSGSTLGVSAINTPFALWVVAFDDAGTVRLGIINCLSGENIFPLGRGSPIASSTAEGGAGGADSAHVFYTGAAVASKPYVVLGRLEWSSGLATLGSWTAPDIVSVYTAGMKLPGDLVQIASDRYTANAALSTAIPNDDTVPTSTEGTQIVSATLTPTSAANRIHARFAGPFDSTSAIYAYAALFNGGSAAIGTVMTTIYGSGYPAVLAMERAQAAANTSSQTWSVRVGGSAAIYANGLSTGRRLGGSLGVTLIVSEVQA